MCVCMCMRHFSHSCDENEKNKLLTHADDASNKFAYSRYNMIVYRKNIKFFDLNHYNLALNFGTFLI